MLWTASVVLIVSSFLAFDGENFLALTASLIGVTSLLFNAKGNPVGQVIGIVFCLIYGFISWQYAYYGEMITYLGMTMPMAVQPTKTGRRQASAGFLKAIFCKAAHQGVTAQVCPSAS